MSVTSGHSHVVFEQAHAIALSTSYLEIPSRLSAFQIVTARLAKQGRCVSYCQRDKNGGSLGYPWRRLALFFCWMLIVIVKSS